MMLWRPMLAPPHWRRLAAPQGWLCIAVLLVCQRLTPPASSEGAGEHWKRPEARDHCVHASMVQELLVEIVRGSLELSGGRRSTAAAARLCDSACSAVCRTATLACRASCWRSSRARGLRTCAVPSASPASACLPASVCWPMRGVLLHCPGPGCCARRNRRRLSVLGDMS